MTFTQKWQVSKEAHAYDVTDLAVWVPFLGTLEVGIGLIAASLPSLGAMFHFFDPPKKSSSSGRRYGRVNSSSFPSKGPRGDNARQPESDRDHLWTDPTVAIPRAGVGAELSPGGVSASEDLSCAVSTKSSYNDLIIQGSAGTIGKAIGERHDDRYEIELKNWQDVV